MARKKCQSAALDTAFQSVHFDRPNLRALQYVRSRAAEEARAGHFCEGPFVREVGPKEIAAKRRIPLGTRRIRRPPGFSVRAISRLTSKSSGRVRCSKISKAMIASNRAIRVCFQKFNPSAWFSLADERFAAIWSKASDRSTPVRSL